MHRMFNWKRNGWLGIGLIVLAAAGCAQVLGTKPASVVVTDFCKTQRPMCFKDAASADALAAQDPDLFDQIDIFNLAGEKRCGWKPSDCEKRGQ